jgi:hypothetical protein
MSKILTPILSYRERERVNSHFIRIQVADVEKNYIKKEFEEKRGERESEFVRRY